MATATVSFSRGNAANRLGRTHQSLFDRFRGIGHQAETPGVTPFGPGMVSTGAVLAKLGSTVFQAAKARAATQYADRDAQLARDYATARIDEIRANIAEKNRPKDPGRNRYSAVTPQGQTIEGLSPGEALTEAHRNDPKESQPKMVHLLHSLFGYQAGTDVSNDELGAAAKSAGLARMEAASKASAARASYPYAQQELEAYDRMMKRDSPEAMTRWNDAGTDVEALHQSIATGDEVARQRANLEIGLPIGFRARTPDDQKALDAALGKHRQRVWEGKMKDLATSIEPRRRAALAIMSDIAAGAGGSSPISPEEQAVLDQVEQATR